MLGEYGFTLNTNTYGPAALDGAVTTLKAKFPMLKALVYWNNFLPDGFTTRLDQPTTIGRAYGEAYRRMANDPYFNTTRTSSAA
jgi:hypothetical protein